MTDQTLNSEIQDYSDWRGRLSDAVQETSQFLKNNNVTDIRTHHQFETVLGALEMITCQSHSWPNSLAANLR